MLQLCVNLNANHIQIFLKRTIHKSRISFWTLHYNLKVSRSQVNIFKNVANYFLKTKANHKFLVLKCTCKGLQKSKSELER